ncbi:hypothetical protein DTO166G5_6777 [Paecilomyces variotii]|nr:hypothetical protein DTO166G5_6777 [Paecilomyces variotii]KAJ9303994.1 hypothetical protein DTO217A2_6527 [Paecilomyces variotii]
MTLSPRGRLDQLPAELLHKIVRYLDFLSLRDLSSTNRTLRDVAIPRLFECISVPFSASGLDILKEVATSLLVKVVKSLQFRVLPRLKNVCARYKVRTSPMERIYSRETHIFYEENGWLPQNTTYENVIERMSTICEEQAKLIGNDSELSSLVTVLQQFSAVEELDMRWGTFPADTCGLGTVLKLCIEKHDSCFERFMEVASRTIGLRLKANPITSLQVSACRMLPGSLHIRAHDRLLHLLACQVDMSGLKCLKVTFEALALDILGKLCKRAGKTLAVLHIQTNFLCYNGRRYGGTPPSIVYHGLDRQIVIFLHTLGQDMSLGEVSVRIGGYTEEYLRLLESLLRGEVSISDCAQFIENF